MFLEVEIKKKNRFIRTLGWGKHGEEFLGFVLFFLIHLRLGAEVDNLETTDRQKQNKKSFQSPILSNQRSKKKKKGQPSEPENF